MAEGVSVPTEGWDFSWFEGRATEERPPWGYARMMADRMARATAALDIDTGGGEVLATVPRPPPLLVATEAWPPNLVRAVANLGPLGASVVAADTDLPFAPASFDLVVSRHPVDTDWARSPRPDPRRHLPLPAGGPGSVGELTDFVMGPQPGSDARRPARAVAEASAAGLRVVDLRRATLRMTFCDVAAVVHFLRKVVWIVPDFTVDRYRHRLADLHRRIEADGPFVAHARRFLIELRRPT